MNSISMKIVIYHKCFTSFDIYHVVMMKNRMTEYETNTSSTVEHNEWGKNQLRC